MVLPKALGGIYVPDGSAPADTIEVFSALCWARGHLWREGHLGEDIQRAVDPLSRWAVDHGLVKRIGQDDVQRLIAEAFHD
jgi:hypothetical protein